MLKNDLSVQFKMKNLGKWAIFYLKFLKIDQGYFVSQKT